jgi:hypothetical protein
MVVLGIWQWRVAGAPHPAGVAVSSWRNYAYAFNWWVFTGVAIWFWWRFMRDQREADLKADAEWAADQAAVEAEAAQAESGAQARAADQAAAEADTVVDGREG